MDTKTCRVCEQTLALSEFYPKAAKCKACDRAARAARYRDNPEHRERMLANSKRWRDERPEYKRRQWLQYRFRLPWAEAERMLDEQGGVCALCKQPPEDGKYLNLDHDHACCPVLSSNDRACGKCYRGFVCQRCNTGLSMFLDDVERFRAAIAYIEAYRERRLASPDSSSLPA